MNLHPQLEKDCIKLGNFTLCSLLLLNDSNYPWFILVPDREGIKEIHHLSKPDRQQLFTESLYLSECLEEVFQPDKLNIAALGNVVPQLHIHHIARFKTDACWPAPVWGAVPAKAYDEADIIHIKQQLMDWFEQHAQQAFKWLTK